MLIDYGLKNLDPNPIYDPLQPCDEGVTLVETQRAVLGKVVPSSGMHFDVWYGI